MGNEDGSNIANLNEDMGEIAGPLIVNDTAKFQEDRPPRSHGAENLFGATLRLRHDEGYLW